VNIAILFDGFYCILIGCLVFRSPRPLRILGVVMALGGLGWLTFLSSSFANYLSPYNLALGLLGEGSVCLWTLLMGVNLQPRQEQAGAAVEWRSRHAVEARQGN
jgi:predicted membrane protein